jgi:hypothetical protein
VKHNFIIENGEVEVVLFAEYGYDEYGNKIKITMKEEVN